jgi:hypothetical protein
LFWVREEYVAGHRLFDCNIIFRAYCILNIKGQY